MKDIFNEHDVYLEPYQHKYINTRYPDIDYINTTTLLSRYFSPFDPITVAKNLIIKSPKYFGSTVDSIIEKWDEIKNQGTKIHEEIDYYLQNGTMPSEPKSLHGIDWYRKYKKKYPMKAKSEVIIHSKDIGIAGMVDLITMNKDNKEVEIIDWKTGGIEFKSYKNKMCPHEITEDLMDSKFEKYTLQLSLYRFMLENYYGLKVINQIVAHITDKGCIGYVAPYRKSHIEKIINNYMKNKG